MEDFFCCVCRQTPMHQDVSPLLFTCGHYACSGCRVDSNCPVDRCDNVSHDPEILEVYEQLRQTQSSGQWGEYMQWVNHLYQRLSEKYPQLCQRCGNRCRPEGCYLCMVCPRCKAPITDLRCAHCGYVDLDNVETVKEVQFSQTVVPSSSSDSSDLAALENELSGGKWLCNKCQYGQNLSFSQKCSNCSKPRLRFQAQCGHPVSGLQYSTCIDCTQSRTNLRAKAD